MLYKDWKEISEYCMNMPGAYETRPFGEYPICYRVMGKIFAQLSPKENWYKITLKTNPDAAEIYRMAYPGVVVRGYHCPPVQQPHWNTIELYQFDKNELFKMINEAYDEIIKKLTKKEQKKLPEIAKCTFVKTNGENKDFAILCKKLDKNLDEIVGAKIQRKKYEKYNQRISIHDVIIAYKNNIPIASGSYKFYDDNTVELKRIYVDKDYRGFDIGKEIVRRLEADAKIAGYKYAVLETGELLEIAYKLYKKLGYKQIPNYGQYACMPESLCMQKKL